jgi:hypothetical protein
MLADVIRNISPSKRSPSCLRLLYSTFTELLLA